LALETLFWPHEVSAVGFWRLEYQGHYGSFCFVRHLRNGAAIARCSQPEISWWGWRNADDEYLVTSIAKACALDPGTRASGGSLSTGTNDASEACDTDFGKAWVVLVPPVIGPSETMGKDDKTARALAFWEVEV
jgi:hypothetical protein